MSYRRRSPSILASILVLLVSLLAACATPSSPGARKPEPLAVGKGHGPEAPGSSGAGSAAAEDDLAIPVTSADAVRGSRNAYVTIVLFTDFQCPFCGRLGPTLARLEEELGHDQLRIVLKNNPLPFHPHARFAAEAGQGVLVTAGPEAFWRFHDLVFENQTGIEPAQILRWAGRAGADEREISRGVAEKRWAAKIDADMELARKLGATGTPASFINGTELVGAQPYERFSEVVTEELERAKSLAERGVARDKIYARLLAVNLEIDGAERDEEASAAKQAAAAAAKAAEATIIWKVPVGTSPVRGSPSALVTVVVFSDYQCPFCKRLEPTLEQLRKAYGDKLRVVWKDQPLSFHANAGPAAQLARAARAQKGDAGFWAMHDALFDAQPALEGPDLERLARKNGLDVKKAMAQVEAKAHKRAIEEDQALADDLGAYGTPTSFVNGRKLAGAQALDAFKALVDEELARAEALVKGGVARKAVYDAAIKDGKAEKDGAEPVRKSIAPPTSAAPFRGTANGKVVIQQVGDFECPFCSRAEAMLDQLVQKYPGKIKLVWRDNPLAHHTKAPLAAEAAREAFAQKGDAGFTKMHKLLFSNTQALERSQLDAYASQIGLDMAKFTKALDERTHKAAVEADVRAVKDAGVTGTPAFFVGPYFIAGAQPVRKLEKLVNRVLNEPAAPTRLVIKDLVVGRGAAVKAGDKISVHYVGTLDGGKEFDSSRTRGTPFSVEIGKGHVIKGWEQGLVGMKVGGKRKLTIPASLGYGERGRPPVIPADATLHFDIELLAISPP